MLRNLDELIANIRKEEGFSRFLLGPSESEMMVMAEYVPIVVFKASKVRSDAIIAKRDGITPLEREDALCGGIYDQISQRSDPVHTYSSLNGYMCRFLL